MLDHDRSIGPFRPLKRWAWTSTWLSFGIQHRKNTLVRMIHAKPLSRSSSIECPRSCTHRLSSVCSECDAFFSDRFSSRRDNSWSSIVVLCHETKYYKRATTEYTKYAGQSSTKLHRLCYNRILKNGDIHKNTKYAQELLTTSTELLSFVTITITTNIEVGCQNVNNGTNLKQNVRPDLKFLREYFCENPLHTSLSIEYGGYGK